MFSWSGEGGEGSERQGMGEGAVLLYLRQDASFYNEASTSY